MPGFTTPDGFIYEVPGDQPGISLHSGLSGTEDILAEQVQTKVATMDATISALQSRVAALENGTGGVGWIPIATGNDSGPAFTIDLTDGGKFPDPPLWNMVRVHMRHDLDTSGGDISLRINGDNSSIYRSAIVGINGTESFTGMEDHLTGADRWVIGRGSTISTGNLELLLFHTASDPGLLNFQATSTRQSSSAGVHVYFMTWGSIESSGYTASTLRVFAGSSPGGGTEFVNAWWWAEGLRMEQPA